MEDFQGAIPKPSTFWPVLDFARSHNLCKDYTSVPALATVSTLVPNSLQESEPNNDDDLPDPARGFVEKERLVCSKDVAVLLRNLTTDEIPCEDCLDITAQFYLVRRSLKLECPILLTDNDLDVARFRRQKSSDPWESVQQLISYHIMKECPDGCDEEVATAWKQNTVIQREKIESSRDGLLYLQSVIRRPPTLDYEMQVDMLASQINQREVGA
jgi:hypothetical protein